MRSGLGDPLRFSDKSLSARIALLATEQPYQRIVRQLEGQDRFSPTILIRAARIDPVAAAAGGEIGHDHPAVVGAEEPAPRGERVLLPFRVALGAPGRSGGFDRRLRLERLLVERQAGMAVAEGLRAHGPEMPFGGDLLPGD